MTVVSFKIVSVRHLSPLLIEIGNERKPSFLIYNLCTYSHHNNCMSRTLQNVFVSEDSGIVPSQPQQQLQLGVRYFVNS